jgi:membrane protein required for colicin V production
MDFNHWDIILFIPLVFAAWKGFQKGLIIELASIAALIAGIYVAANFSEVTAQKLKEWLSLEGSWLGYLSFLVTFIAVVFGVYALAKVVEKAVNMVALKLVNKIAGLAFGTLKVALIVSIILNLLGWLDRYVPVLSKSEPNKSLLFNPVKSIAPTILPVLMSTEWLSSAETFLAPQKEEE